MSYCVLVHEDKGTIPATVSNLVFPSKADAEAWLLSALSIVQRPPRVSLDDDGTLDDFMVRDVALVHFEALDDSQWYATIQLADGEVWQLNFGATNPRAKGYARAESIGTFPIQIPGLTT